MKALKIEIDDPSTGAVAGLHVIGSYTVDVTAKFCQSHIHGFVSAKALADGKRAVGIRHVTVPGLPGEGDDPMTWIYTRLAIPADDAARAHPAYQPSPFVGAELVEV